MAQAKPKMGQRTGEEAEVGEQLGAVLGDLVSEGAVTGRCYSATSPATLPNGACSEAFLVLQLAEATRLRVG